MLSEILGAISRNDFGAIAEHLTEDVELHISGFPSMDGSWSGRQQVVDAIAVNFGKITEQTTETESMIQQGNAIVVLIREHGRLKQDDRPYNVRCVIWWTFEGDRIVRVEEFVRRTD